MQEYSTVPSEEAGRLANTPTLGTLLSQYRWGTAITHIARGFFELCILSMLSVHLVQPCALWTLCPGLAASWKSAHIAHRLCRRACTVLGSAPIAHSLCRRACTVLGSEPIAHSLRRTAWHGTRVGAHRSRPLPNSVHGTRVGAHPSQPLPKSVHGTRVGAHRSQLLLNSVHGTRVGAHRSQPLPKSVHGTRVGAHRSQLLLNSVHGTRVGAHRSQPLPKSVHGTRVGAHFLGIDAMLAHCLQAVTCLCILPQAQVLKHSRDGKASEFTTSACLKHQRRKTCVFHMCII